MPGMLAESEVAADPAFSPVALGVIERIGGKIGQEAKARSWCIWAIDLHKIDLVALCMKTTYKL